MHDEVRHHGTLPVENHLQMYCIRDQVKGLHIPQHGPNHVEHEIPKAIGGTLQLKISENLREVNSEAAVVKLICKCAADGE